MYSTIEIGGNEYPLHFGSAALNQYCRKYNITLGALLSKLTSSIPRKADGTIITDEAEAEKAESFNFQFTLEEVVAAFRFAVNSGYRKAGTPDKAITEDDAFDLFDEKPGLAMEVFGMFAQSVMTLFNPAQEKKANPKAEALKS